MDVQQGVTATNPNVNIVQWFGDNIFGDLQAAAGGRVHPALQVDAIRYLYTFRYQVRSFFSRSHPYLIVCDSSRRSNWFRCYRCC